MYISMHLFAIYSEHLCVLVYVFHIEISSLICVYVCRYKVYFYTFWYNAIITFLTKYIICECANMHKRKQKWNECAESETRARASGIIICKKHIL